MSSSSKRRKSKYSKEFKQDAVTLTKERSMSSVALAKKQSKSLPDGTGVCKFRVLLDSLSSISKCEYQVCYAHPPKHIDDTQRRTFESISSGTKEQQKALDQLKSISELMAP